MNLEVGSGSQARQTADIMTRYEDLLAESRPTICVVVGDVTSTMACAITARKLGVEVAHVEGGIRSGDLTMPEEINRIVTDSISNYFFTTSESANQNLRAAGVDEGRIFFVGNTMIDTLLANMDRLTPPPVWTELNLEAERLFRRYASPSRECRYWRVAGRSSESDRRGSPRGAMHFPGASAHDQNSWGAWYSARQHHCESILCPTWSSTFW